MAIVTDSTPVEEPKDVQAPVFALWSLFASPAEREELFERARTGGLGYGDVKKDLLARLLDHFGAMRQRRAELEKRPNDVQAILFEGARRASAEGAPVLDACRAAAGLGASA